MRRLSAILCIVLGVVLAGSILFSGSGLPEIRALEAKPLAAPVAVMPAPLPTPSFDEALGRLEEQHGTLEGTVRDPQGTPLGGVHLGEALTNEQGRYAMVLPAGAAKLKVWAVDERAAVYRALEVLPGRSITLDLVLPGLAFLAGTVKRAGGAPLPPGEVLVRADVEQLSFTTLLEKDRFRLPVVAGTYWVGASWKGGRRSRTPERIEAAAGATVELELTLEEPLAPVPPSLSGTVLGLNGAPAADAEVRLLTDRGARHLARTDGAGRFTFPPQVVAFATVVVSANHPAGFVEPRTLELGSEDVALQLAAPVTLHGEVSGVGGAKVDGFDLELRSIDGWTRTQRFGGASFSIAAPPGKVRLRVVGTGRSCAELEVSGTRDAQAPLEVALKPSALLVGRALDARTGAPLTSGHVTLDGREQTQHEQHLFDQQGRFVAGALLPGQCRVRIWAPHRRQEIREVALKAGEVTELGDILLGWPSTIPGTIGAGFLDQEGQVRVSVVNVGGPAEQAGLVEGDLVVSIDGKPMRSAVQARSKVIGEPGTPLELLIRRDGEVLSLPLTRAQ